MKNLKTIKVSRIFLDSKELVREQLIRLDGEKSLSSLLSRFAFKIVSLCLRGSKNATSRIRLYHKFGLYLLNMNKRHGSVYVVKYLKACNLAVSKVIAGQPFSSLREIEPDLPLPRLSRSGLPCIIGTRDRRSIVQGSHKVIKLYLSLFNLYRVIVIESKSKLNTITDGYEGNWTFLNIFGSWLSVKTEPVIGRFLSKSSISSHNYLFRETSSPNFSKSWSGAVMEASMIYHNKELYSHFVDYCNATNSSIIKLINNIGKVVKPEDWVAFSVKKNATWALGQLSTKAEPAGKLRVFAIVDGWTQSLLAPLHKFLFGILKKLPNDGTFDQGAAFDRACAKAKQFNCCYGYDLSAATDRLPIKIQVDILASLIGRSAAEAWKSILVSRPYLLKRNKEEGFDTYHYAVGQPMGALSSWAMLAITHHMVMQYCSRMINPSLNTWETRYEVLGDDIVIFSPELAAKYLEVMALIGVPINESKSIVSVNKPVVEFAKRTWFNHEVSPLPWKQFISQDTFKGRINTVLGLFLKEKSFLEKPLSVIDTIMKRTLWDSRPKKDPILFIALMNTYFEKLSNINYFLRYIRSTEPMITKGRMLFANFNFEFSKNLLASLLKDRKLPAIGRKDGNYLLFEFAVKEALRARLITMMNKYDDYWVERQVIAHNKVLLGSLPKSKTIQLNFLCRNLLFNQKISYLTLWNESIINDPKISVERLLEILDEKLGELSNWTYVERLNDPSSKLPSIEIDTCSILQLVVKGFNHQYRVEKSQTFDKDRFIQFVRKEQNWKPFLKQKGFEVLDEMYKE
jgi:hypothetical protein